MRNWKRRVAAALAVVGIWCAAGLVPAAEASAPSGSAQDAAVSQTQDASADSGVQASGDVVSTPETEAAAESLETLEIGEATLDPVNAAIGGGGETETMAASVPRATFTNAKSDTPDLYVKKEVVNADDRYPADADALFTFQLKLDGEVAKKTPYQVYNASGQELTLSNGVETVKSTEASGDDSTEATVTYTYRTDSNGRFTLKAGQTARFPYVGEGVAYEVEEVSQPSGDYTQVSPAGTAVGTTGEDGAIVEFTNRYSPSETPPTDPSTDPEDQTTKLTVQKVVSFPKGYEYDAAEEFTFVLTIDGEAYARESYTVTDSSTGEALSTGTTDESGRFTLCGGQTASFDVPLDVDYQVEEESKDGWTVYGDSSIQAGAVTYPSTDVTFTNLRASFGVSKTADTDTEDVFTFFLYDGKGNAWAGQSYYLYTSAGKRADEETHATGTDGKFTLQSGQTALFLGIPVGTSYRVQEQQSVSWTQTGPASAQGYSRTVSASVEILPFANQSKDNGENTLTVLKNILPTSEEQAPEETAEFTFCLYTVSTDESGKETEIPASGQVYSITSGKDTLTYKTDENGKFTLQGNQAATFAGLTKGTTYRVRETITNWMYTISADDSVRTGTLGAESAETNATEAGSAETSAAETGAGTGTDVQADENGNLIFQFDNQYTLCRVRVVKYDSDGETLLANVRFRLTGDGVDKTLATDTNGELLFENLRPGTYTLTETKTVKGHSLLPGSITVTVPLTLTGQEAIDKNADTSDPDKAFYDKAADTWYFRELTYTVTNDVNLDVPVAGGGGNPIAIGLAGALTAGFGVWLAISGKRRKKA